MINNKNNNVQLHSCPTCKKSLAWSKDNAFRPFCCERCKLIDLGAWADGTYAVEGDEVPPDDDQFC